MIKSWFALCLTSREITLGMHCHKLPSGTANCSPVVILHVHNLVEFQPMCAANAGTLLGHVQYQPAPSIPSVDLYADGLDLSEELEGVRHPLAPDARRLDAPEGHVQVSHEPTVGPHRAHLRRKQEIESH